MKTTISFGCLLLLAIFPFYLQAQQIELPGVEVQATQDKIPAKVKAAVIDDFGTDHEPYAWVNPQTNFNTLLWEQSTNVDNMEIFYYSVSTRTSAGHQLQANYTPDGKLISSREFYKNIALSHPVKEALQKSEFSDWKVAREIHTKNILRDGSERERYFVKLKKGNEKKAILLDKDGKMLPDKKNFFKNLLAETN